MSDAHLEPRVAKLEEGLDRLTEDVRSLASIVRDQGSTVEKQLSELTIAVTQAAGPKKTDWGTLISAILLLMAIGSAVFWPLNQTVEENKTVVESLSNSFQTHNQLPLHPVGQALLQRLELQLKDHLTDDREMHDVMMKNITKENEYIQRIYDLELSSLKEKTQLHVDKLYERVVKLEDRNSLEIEREKDELQMWRMRALGVTSEPPISIHTHEVVEQKKR